MKLGVAILIISIAGFVTPFIFFEPKCRGNAVEIEVSSVERPKNDSFILPALDFGGKADEFTFDVMTNVDNRLKSMTFEVDVSTTDEEELDDILDKILRDTAVSQGVELEESCLKKLKKKIILKVINFTGRTMIRVFM